MALAAPNISFTDTGGVARPVFEVAFKAVPTGLTSEVSVDCRLLSVQIMNPSGSGVTRTVTIEDGAGNQIDFATLAPGGRLDWEQPKPGFFCSGGIQWVASGTGLLGSMQAGQP